MEPSPEMANVLGRLLDAIRDGDEQAVSNRFSRQPGFERFGSDPAEHWRDGDEAALVLIQQIRETAGRALRVKARRPRRDPVAIQESPRQPRVLGGDQRHGPQDRERAQGDVGQVPDRSRDDVQAPASHPRAEPGRRRG